MIIENESDKKQHDEGKAEIKIRRKSMRTKRRDDNLIASQILEICQNGAGKTKILYQANLNSTKVNQYLDNLIKNGFIAEISMGHRVIYKTTSSGQELKKRLDELQNEIEDLHANLFNSRLKPEFPLKLNL
jgi:predicted transcriptional regulator